MKKHLLFLTHYFPPEVNAPANRTFEHCKLWVTDIEVTVITNFPNHPDGKIFPDYKNKLVQKENNSGINVVRLWTFITPNEGFILRTLNYIIYMMAAVTYVLLSRIKFDVVIATTPQFFCGLAGKFISQLKNKPFILELRDLWPDSIVAVGALKNKTIISILTKIELGLYKSAALIVSVTNSFKENLISRGIDNNKIEVIYNGVDEQIFSEIKPIKDQALKSFLENGFKVGYIGTLGMAHSLSTLIDAAKVLEKEEVKFIIVGSGAERERLENEIKEKRLNNIAIFPLQPKSERPSIIEALDLFFVHLKKNDLFKTVIPSKIFEGMIMKKPILVGVDGETRKIIEDAECGLFFEPENVDDLVSKILLYKNSPQLILRHGENGYKHVLKYFNRAALAQNYLTLINQVIEEK